MVILLVVTVVVLGRGRRSSAGRCCSPASTRWSPQARGVPVRWLSVAFLVLLGAAVAEVSQITGSLLVFALLVMPAATAQALSARPATSLVLSVVVALVITWVGLGVAYFSVYPIGFYVTTIGFGLYVLAVVARRVTCGDVLHQRPDRRHGHRRRVWTDRLLPGAARPGVHRRRAVPCGVHRRRWPPWRSASTCASACSWRRSAIALLMAALGRRGMADDVVIGNIFAWILGLGAFFLTLYTTNRSTGNGSAGITVLFGSIFGISTSPGARRGAGRHRAGPGDAACWPGRCCSPRSTRRSRQRVGVPVRLLGALFLAVVGACAGGGHPGGRRDAAARPAGRPGRHGHPADRPPVPSARPVRAGGAGRHVGGPGRKLRGAERCRPASRSSPWRRCCSRRAQVRFRASSRRSRRTLDPHEHLASAERRSGDNRSTSPRTRMLASVPSGCSSNRYVTCIGNGPATDFISSSVGGS